MNPIVYPVRSLSCSNAGALIEMNGVMRKQTGGSLIWIHYPSHNRDTQSNNSLEIKAIVHLIHKMALKYGKYTTVSIRVSIA
ncbi:UNVERIFIED_CONTAM: hypothetical protein FKN15_012149 [Acipenser sinensis]